MRYGLQKAARMTANPKWRRKPGRSPNCRALWSRSCAVWSTSRRRAPAGVHEVKFDGYRMQLRVDSGKVKLLTRKGLDWTQKFTAIAKAPPDCPTASSTARSAPLTTMVRRTSRRLQAALSDGKSEPLIFLPLICCSPMAKICVSLPLIARKTRLATIVEGSRKRHPVCVLSSIFPAAVRSGSAVGLPH